MRYTQLDYSPYSPRRKTLLQQAGFLLRELVADRHHEFPCDCGTCIYWAYSRSERKEGRRFSKRTFFMFFLRSDLSLAALVSPLPAKYGRQMFWGTDRSLRSPWLDKRWEKMRLSAERARGQAMDSRRLKKEPPILADDIYRLRIQRDARRKTFTMLEELARVETNPARRAFLRGLLAHKCFYTYYARAADRMLYGFILEAREKLRSTVDRRD